MRSDDQISVQELAQLRKNNDIFILDVRNVDEYHVFNLGGTLIPLAELTYRIGELPQDKLIVVYCHSGMRSQRALELLQQTGFTQVKNLSGGILAWQQTMGSLPD